MVRHLRSFSIFVASPSDVHDERVRLEEIIRGINKTWSKHFAIQFELRHWETDVTPGFGEYSQDVINKQIDDDYDIFIGIMWCRFGTPTKQADSGTIEEFERAKKRLDDNHNSIKIMFYFKEAAIPPNEIDPQQLEKVNTFKSSFGAMGGLYFKFNTMEQFEHLLRSHLEIYLQNISKQTNLTLEKPATESALNSVVCAPTQPESNIMNGTSTDADDDDEGILDFMIKAEDGVANMKQIMDRIGASTTDLSQELDGHTQKILTLQDNNKGDISKKAIKRLTDKAADDMHQYARRIETEIPALNKGISESMNATLAGMRMAIEGGDNGISQNDDNDVLKAFITLKDTIQTVLSQTKNFQDTITRLPRLTSNLNKAKRHCAEVIDKLLAEFAIAHDLVSEIVIMLENNS